jgi:hypothetical protein
MIIRIDGASDHGVREASRSVQELTAAWGHPATVTAAPGEPGHDDKAVDPVALSALILSVPPAALAVWDLADRIRKRKRAGELIDQARELGERGVTVSVVYRERVIEIRTLTPDQLLDESGD